MPKTELHLHIEGTMEPGMMMDLAKRNGLPAPYESLDEAKKAYKRGTAFKDLDEFLDVYYNGMNVLRTEQDFYDLTYAYLKKVKDENVTHTEIFFDPQGHTARGIPLDTVINGIHHALEDAKQNLGISSRLILSFLRHLSENDAQKTLTDAQPYIERGYIDGFGLDSSENGFPPSKFKNVFAEARETGLHITAHAGEEGPPEYVREALDLLKVERIDHGNRSLEDTALIERLVEEKKGLTVCPLSNLKLGGVFDLESHPLKKMLRLGLKATINSDDPAYFDGYMNDNFLKIAEAQKLTREDIITLARNAIAVSFLSPEEKLRKNEELTSYIRRKNIERPAPQTGLRGAG